MSETLARTATAFAALLTLATLPAAGPAPGPGPGAEARLTAGPPPAAAQEARQARETTVVVRAVSHDAKVIGSGVGGARITIRNAETGEIMARGLQRGGTGSTERIMRTPHERGATVYGTEDAAGFRATLRLERPTLVEVSAEGPLDTPQAVRRASLTTLLLPGRDVTGEGLILELYGLTVELEEPGQGGAPSAGADVPVRARVTMLCGCPITDGGLWDAARYDVSARLHRDGRIVDEATLDYAGRPNTFEGRIVPPDSGRYWLEVVAADAERGNFGRVQRALRVR